VDRTAIAAPSGALGRVVCTLVSCSLYCAGTVDRIAFDTERISRFQEFFDTYAAGEAFRTDHR
jgi:hypothetical protein